MNHDPYRPSAFAFPITTCKVFPRREELDQIVNCIKPADSILSGFDEEGMALHRELVNELPHMNKTLLRYLKAMNEYDLARKNSIVVDDKSVVYHKLTKEGLELNIEKEGKCDNKWFTAGLIDALIQEKRGIDAIRNTMDRS